MVARLASKIAIASILLVTGAIVGPIVMALVGALLSRTHQGLHATPEQALVYDPGEAADLLSRAYEPHRPPSRAILTIDIPKASYWRDCGYPGLDGDRASLTEEMRTTQEASLPARATLRDAFGQFRLAEQERATVAKLDRAASTFSEVFLRRCIQSTVAQDYCVARVTRLLDGDPWEQYGYETPAEREVRCLFLDGIAARNGLPLARRSALGSGGAPRANND